VLCEECGQKPATVHVTRVSNGQKTERHLCEQCAREQGELEFVIEPQFSVQNLLASLLGHDALHKQAVGPPRGGGACGLCGLSYDEFARTGRLGCGRCYQEFGDRLEPLLRRIHGSAVHSGKVPVRRGVDRRHQRTLAGLKEELARAVEKEEFERAAELRDRIKELESELGREERP